MKKVLVVNNPQSLLALFTELVDGVDDIWLEKGANPGLDRSMEQACSFLGLDQQFTISSFHLPNLFSAAAQRSIIGKIFAYRKIARKVSEVCRHEGVDVLVCSTTSSFRLAKVPMIEVVDHGTGDYLRLTRMTKMERLKYSHLYSSAIGRTFRYHAYIPLPDRSYLRLNSDRIKARLAHHETPFRQDRISIILLVYPILPLAWQLRRLTEVMGDQTYDLYLKGHYFAKDSISPPDEMETGAPEPQLLPEGFSSIPAELLPLGVDAPLRIIAFESTTLWNLGILDPELVFSLGHREEVAELLDWSIGIDWIEKQLGYSPFLQKE